MQFNSVQYIAHPVQWLSILLFFPFKSWSHKLFLVLSFFDKFLWMYSTSPPRNPLVLPCHTCIYYLVTYQTDQILKLVWLFFYHSCNYISCQSIFLFLLALQPIAGLFFTIFRWFIPVVRNYKNYNWYKVYKSNTTQFII